MPDIAVLNGRLMPLSRAMISVEDRGGLFGDGVYEVVRVYGGAPFLLREHLRRFERSARAIQLEYQFDRLSSLRISQAYRVLVPDKVWGTGTGTGRTDRGIGGTLGEDADARCAHIVGAPARRAHGG